MRTLGALIFPGFQTLDYFGPIEMLAGLWGEIELVTVAKTVEPTPSRHGQRILPDVGINAADDYDVLFIPGGDSALELAKDPEMMDWLRAASGNAERVLAVCTGTVLLGITGVLDGRRATTNKLDFVQTIPLAPNVTWVKQARWVQDGKYFTSSGVSAGMDMALAAVADLFGEDVAEEMAEGCEYTWHRNPDEDPFARSAGLV